MPFFPVLFPILLRPIFSSFLYIVKEFSRIPMPVKYNEWRAEIGIFNSIFYQTNSEYKKHNFSGISIKHRFGVRFILPISDKSKIFKFHFFYNRAVSHYWRKHAPRRRYLPPELNAHTMYQDFTKQHPDSMIKYITYWRQIGKMKIRFAKLGEEECEVVWSKTVIETVKRFSMMHWKLYQIQWHAGCICSVHL